MLKFVSFRNHTRELMDGFGSHYIPFRGRFMITERLEPGAQVTWLSVSKVAAIPFILAFHNNNIISNFWRYTSIYSYAYLSRGQGDDRSLSLVVILNVPALFSQL